MGVGAGRGGRSPFSPCAPGHHPRPHPRPHPREIRVLSNLVVHIVGTVRGKARDGRGPALGRGRIEGVGCLKRECDKVGVRPFLLPSCHRAPSSATDRGLGRAHARHEAALGRGRGRRRGSISGPPAGVRVRLDGLGPVQVLRLRRHGPLVHVGSSRRWLGQGRARTADDSITVGAGVKHVVVDHQPAPGRLCARHSNKGSGAFSVVSTRRAGGPRPARRTVQVIAVKGHGAVRGVAPLSGAEAEAVAGTDSGRAR